MLQFFNLFFLMNVVYEDNHIIIVSKVSGEIVQGDKTGDKPLSDMVKQYIKEAYAKPGDVFLVWCTVWTVPCSDWCCLPAPPRRWPA